MKSPSEKKFAELASEHRLLLGLLLALTPIVTLTIYLVWFVSDWSWHGKVFASAVVFLPLLLSLLHLPSRLSQQWRVLVNVAESVRRGDYSLRGRGSRDPGAYGELVRELNALAEQLQQQRLHTVEQQLLVEKIIRDIDVAIFAFDHQQRLTLANTMALHLLQAPLEQLRQQSAEALGMHGLLAVQDSEVREHAFAGQHGQWHVRVEQYRERGLPHYLLFVSDLQHVLRREEQKVWTRLIRVLSHEVNNSLSPIISISESLRAVSHDLPAETADDLQHGLQVIQERASSLNRFVRRYAELARLPTPQCQPIDLREVLSALKTLQAASQVEFDIEPGQLPVFVDAGQLQQALLNLLKNAIEAGDEGAAVQLRVRANKQQISLQVLDQGSGIANPGNLFVPFYSTKPGGSGIGLLICRQIVEAHGGSLSLRNREDRQGCVAEVLLPKALG